MKVVRSVLIFVAITLFYGCSTDRDHSIKSPDENIEVEVWLNESGGLMYNVSRSGMEVIEGSQLGLIRADSDFSAALNFKSVSSSEHIEMQYEMLQGKSKLRQYEANQRTFVLENSMGESLEVVFRVSDEGVAFQYRFPEPHENVVTVEDELTFFKIPERSKAWLTPMAVVNTGWSETNPSYEEYYEIGIDVGTSSPLGVGWSYPALFQTPSSDWVLITESGMDGSYPGTRLRTVAENGLYKTGFPAEEEVTTNGIRGPEFDTPWESPWRVIAVGDLATIVESTLGTDVAKPTKYEDTDYIKSGRASWSWAKLKDASVNYDTQIQFIDFAAEMGWEYTLVDVNWDQNIGYERIAELADYASEKGVGLWLWYNSSGDWNSSPYTPKSALVNREERLREFERISEIGIQGVKVDFFPGDGQSSLQYYIDIFEDAHEHQLMVNTHGSTIPRGWHKTYPNLMTMESVKGFEFITFEQVNANEAPSHATILPFTRNAFDPMDFTPMSLDEIPNIDRLTTSTHELALPVIFWSGVQNYAETPSGMETVPTFVKEFVREIPSAWDETKFIDGFPGEFVIIARRSGEEWFIGGINGENNDQSVSVDFSFLQDEVSGYLISDGEDAYSFSEEELHITPKTELEIEMSSYGGFVIHLNGVNQ